MAIKTFMRYELKYILSEKQYRDVVKEIAPYVGVDKYCVGGKTYGLYNIYYDTDDYEIIRHSISKPSFKQKLRIRSYYENPADDDIVYVEIKKKADGCVNKRRISMKYSDALRLLECGHAEYNDNYMHNIVLHETETYLSRHKVGPKAYIAYDREAYFYKQDKNIRITFDRNVRGAPAFERESCVPLLEDGIYLMEIKVSDRIPPEISAIMNKHGVYRHGFSKYGTYYRDYIFHRKEIKLNECIK